MFKKGVYLTFFPIFHNGYKDLPNFLHECRGQQGPLFGLDGFSEKVLILDYRGLSVQKMLFFTSLSFSQQRL